jgi:hypothetical protein
VEFDLIVLDITSSGHTNFKVDSPSKVAVSGKTGGHRLISGGLAQGLIRYLCKIANRRLERPCNTVELPCQRDEVS